MTRRRSLLFASALATVACHGSTELAVTAVGSYALSTVAQKPLPVQLSTGDSVLSGGVMLYGNGAYAISWLAPTHYFGTRSVIAKSDSGSWTSAGSQLRFVSLHGDTLTGVFTSPTLSVSVATDEWKFTKH